MTDFRWGSVGGILLDGTGDIQTTDPTVPESLVDMVYTILKADLDSWKLYAIGANLSYFIGQTVDPEVELKIKRAITDSLTRTGLLSRGDFTVVTVPSQDGIQAIVYISNVAVATVTVPQSTDAQITVK